MKQKRGIAAMFAAALAVLLAVTGAAWACSAVSTITIAPGAAPAGSRLDVSGQTPTYGSGPLELRWNSASGPVVGSAVVASDKTFATQVTIPQTPAGVYLLTLVAADQTLARTVVEVAPSNSPLDPALRTIANDAWSGFKTTAADLGANSPSSAPMRGSAAAGLALSAAGLMALSAGLVIAIRTRVRRRSQAG